MTSVLESLKKIHRANRNEQREAGIKSAGNSDDGTLQRARARSAFSARTTASSSARLAQRSSLSVFECRNERMTRAAVLVERCRGRRGISKTDISRRHLVPHRGKYAFLLSLRRRPVSHVDLGVTAIGEHRQRPRKASAFGKQRAVLADDVDARRTPYRCVDSPHPASAA